jgi:hypothetical protein
MAKYKDLRTANLLRWLTPRCSGPLHHTSPRGKGKGNKAVEASSREPLHMRIHCLKKNEKGVLDANN